MPFRLQKDTRDFFKHIKFSEWDFDMYYFSVMAGLATRNKDDPSSETTDLIAYFPKPYQDVGRIIVSIFIATELEELGISMSEKDAVRNQIRTLIQPNSSGYLSDIGFKEINRYCFGGQEKLDEWFPEKPRTVEYFIIKFRKQIANCLLIK